MIINSANNTIKHCMNNLEKKFFLFLNSFIMNSKEWKRLEWIFLWKERD